MLQRIGVRAFARSFSTRARLYNAPTAATLESKYAEKLKAKMQEKGVETLDQLKATAPKTKVEPVGTPKREDFAAKPKPPTSKPTFSSSERKDSSPVKPLSSFLDISKIMKTPHTAEQISSLWLVYHASRSNGTGRGYLSAHMTHAQYQGMLERARKYPLFILPLPCTIPADPTANPPTEEKIGTEFYFMQWDTHHRAEAPSAVDPTSLDALLSPQTNSSSSPLPPPISTIILTPLQEYKLHGTYAQPRLVLTHYPNFAHTHDVILLRGEISESTAGNGGFLLTQIDAQMLALAMQKFYLPSDAEPAQEAFELLKAFHEAPETFDYEKLIETARLI